jgi:dihydroxyacetone kinase-like protein
MTAVILDVAGVARWIHAFRERIEAQVSHLTELDSAIGDGDHGINMVRGVAAVDEAIAAGVADGTIAGIGPAFTAIGMGLISKVGGAPGPLYGTMFLRMGATLDRTTELDATDVADALARGLTGLRARGKALPGDKTLIDALTPAVEAMRAAIDAGADLGLALTAASRAADAGRDATVHLLARQGRASYLGERSIGHQDPGATSMALLIEAAAQTLNA